MHCKAPWCACWQTLSDNTAWQAPRHTAHPRHLAAQDSASQNTGWGAWCVQPRVKYSYAPQDALPTTVMTRGDREWHGRVATQRHHSGTARRGGRESKSKRCPMNTRHILATPDTTSATPASTRPHQHSSLARRQTPPSGERGTTTSSDLSQQPVPRRV